MKRNMTVFVVTLSFLVLLAYGASVGASSGRQVNDGASAPEIEGTWLLTVTTPPQGMRPPFKVLITFARGGAFLASEESDHGTPPQNGTWGRAGGNQFASTALSFGQDQNGNLFTIKISSLFTRVDENTLQGVGEAAICDASGNNCQRFPGCSSLYATRVTVESPSCP